MPILRCPKCGNMIMISQVMSSIKCVKCGEIIEPSQPKVENKEQQEKAQKTSEGNSQEVKRLVPKNVTQGVPQNVPTATAIATATAAPQAAPQNAPRTAPQAAPQNAPRTAPQAAPQNAPRTAPQAAPQNAPRTAPQAAPQAAPQNAPQNVPNAAPQNVPNAAPQNVPNFQQQPNQYAYNRYSQLKISLKERIEKFKASLAKMPVANLLKNLKTKVNNFSESCAGKESATCFSVIISISLVLVVLGLLNGFFEAFSHESFWNRPTTSVYEINLHYYSKIGILVSAFSSLLHVILLFLFFLYSMRKQGKLLKRLVYVALVVNLFITIVNLGYCHDFIYISFTLVDKIILLTTILYCLFTNSKRAYLLYLKYFIVVNFILIFLAISTYSFLYNLGLLAIAIAAFKAGGGFDEIKKLVEKFKKILASLPMPGNAALQVQPNVAIEKGEEKSIDSDKEKSVEPMATQAQTEKKTFSEGFVAFFKRCFDYKGVSSRKEFYAGVLIVNLIALFLLLAFLIPFQGFSSLLYITQLSQITWSHYGFYFICSLLILGIFVLVFVLPLIICIISGVISLYIRRLRDSGAYPYLYILIYLLLLGGIIYCISEYGYDGYSMWYYSYDDYEIPIGLYILCPIFGIYHCIFVLKLFCFGTKTKHSSLKQINVNKPKKEVVDFPSAVESLWNNWFNFKGTANRFEHNAKYFIFPLLLLAIPFVLCFTSNIINILAAVTDEAFAFCDDKEYLILSLTIPISLCVLYVFLRFFIGYLSVMIRRLHSVGYSGKLFLIPIISFVLLVGLTIGFYNYHGSNRLYLLLGDEEFWGFEPMADAISYFGYQGFSIVYNGFAYGYSDSVSFVFFLVSVAFYLTYAISSLWLLFVTVFVKPLTKEELEANKIEANKGQSKIKLCFAKNKRKLVTLFVIVIVLVASLIIGFIVTNHIVQANTIPNLVGNMVEVPGKNYKMGKYEVTMAEWNYVMEENMNYEGDMSRPAYPITFEQAEEFVERLNELPEIQDRGVVFRLPTVDEWYYAYGETDIENNDDLYYGGYMHETRPVGEGEPNTIGLYDMDGNVRELTIIEDSEDYVLAGSGNYSSDYSYYYYDDDREMYPTPNGNRYRNDGSAGFRLVMLSKEEYLAEQEAKRKAKEEKKRQVVLGIIENMVRVPEKYHMMGKFEVTQEQWITIMGENPSKFNEDLSHPVENVSWEDCQKFIEKLNAYPEVVNAGITFRLPTVEEWQYACAAGGTGYYGKTSYGYDIYSIAWFYSNSDYETNPVGKKKANVWGFYDMHGNVEEWTSTQDVNIRYQTNYYVCGGSYDSLRSDCEINSKSSKQASTQESTIGLRLFATSQSLIEQERIDLEKAEQERIAREKAEEEARIAREKAEEEARIAREKEEQERLAREEEERRVLKEGKIRSIIDNMVLLPSKGEFQGLYISKYEVTQEQWVAVMGENPSRFSDGDSLPVDSVSWNDCQEFIKRLNELPTVKESGFIFSLPTLDEWTYACLAGGSGKYGLLSNGYDGTIEEMGWYEDNSDDETHPVGRKIANAWGLYDMHGNVWEWLDSSSLSYYIIGGSYTCSDLSCNINSCVDEFQTSRDQEYGLRLSASKVE